MHIKALTEFAGRDLLDLRVFLPRRYEEHEGQVYLALIFVWFVLRSTSLRTCLRGELIALLTYDIFLRVVRAPRGELN